LARKRPSASLPPAAHGRRRIGRRHFGSRQRTKVYKNACQTGLATSGIGPPSVRCQTLTHVLCLLRVQFCMTTASSVVHIRPAFGACSQGSSIVVRAAAVEQQGKVRQMQPRCSEISVQVRSARRCQLADSETRQWYAGPRLRKQLTDFGPLQ